MFFLPIGSLPVFIGTFAPFFRKLPPLALKKLSGRSI